jgi:hypothetical protein
MDTAWEAMELFARFGVTRQGQGRRFVDMSTSDIQHRVDAISRALHDWDDLEVLRLLRLHWPVLEGLLREPSRSPPQSIALSALKTTPRQVHHMITSSADNGSAHEAA